LAKIDDSFYRVGAFYLIFLALLTVVSLVQLPTPVVRLVNGALTQRLAPPLPNSTALPRSKLRPKRYTPSGINIAMASLCKHEIPWHLAAQLNEKGL
jgi:hypothetical protein